MFYGWMNCIEGIPIALLNLIVFVSIVFIIKQPSGTCISLPTKYKSTGSKNVANTFSRNLMYYRILMVVDVAMVYLGYIMSNFSPASVLMS